MIGKICTAAMPYYDKAKKINSFKKRPVLIIGQADRDDYNALPVSRVTNLLNISAEYDVYIDITVYPNTHLSCNSYIRCHKQVYVHRASLTVVSDLSTCYPDLYRYILHKLQDYNNQLICQDVI